MCSWSKNKTWQRHKGTWRGINKQTNQGETRNRWTQSGKQSSDEMKSRCSMKTETKTINMCSWCLSLWVLWRKGKSWQASSYLMCFWSTTQWKHNDARNKENKAQNWCKCMTRLCKDTQDNIEWYKYVHFLFAWSVSFLFSTTKLFALSLITSLQESHLGCCFFLLELICSSNNNQTSWQCIHSDSEDIQYNAVHRKLRVSLLKWVSAVSCEQKHTKSAEVTVDLNHSFCDGCILPHRLEHLEQRWETHTPWQ